MNAPHLQLAVSPPERSSSPSPSQGPGESTIRVLLADDHAQMRRSLRLLLEDEHDIEVVAEAADLGSVVTQLDGERPSVLVLDLRMPGGSSGETIERLRERAPATRIVVVTMDENPVFAERALASGALGFVTKDLADEELPRAVRAAANGERCVSPRIAARLEALNRALASDTLSPRELEVLQLIALGHTNVEIAQKLELSPRTVETHRARIQRKLELSTRAELVRYAIHRGLLRVPVTT
jgi:two-component system response regulator NreC